MGGGMGGGRGRGRVDGRKKKLEVLNVLQQE